MYLVLIALIVADSFGILNIRLVATDTMRIAQNFKFLDYYSAYDIEEHLANLKKKSKETKEIYTELKEAGTHL